MTILEFFQDFLHRKLKWWVYYSKQIKQLKNVAGRKTDRLKQIQLERDTCLKQLMQHMEIVTTELKAWK